MKHTTISSLYYSLIMGVALFFLATPSPASAQEKKNKIVIDASRDGGVWWFPQKDKKFSTAKPRQGKELADYLRKLSPEVEEIGRGEVITTRLKDAAIVVRFNIRDRGYTMEEAAAYKDYVEKGGRVLLVFSAPEKGSNDSVADALGIRLGQAAQTPFIKKWANHPMTTGLKDVPFGLGTVISGYPESSVQLGMMANGQSVFGMGPVGKGKVIYLGSYAPLIAVSQPLTERIFAELSRK